MADKILEKLTEERGKVYGSYNNQITTIDKIEKLLDGLTLQNNQELPIGFRPLRTMLIFKLCRMSSSPLHLDSYLDLSNYAKLHYDFLKENGLGSSENDSFSNESHFDNIKDMEEAHLSERYYDVNTGKKETRVKPKDKTYRYKLNDYLINTHCIDLEYFEALPEAVVMDYKPLIDEELKAINSNEYSMYIGKSNNFRERLIDFQSQKDYKDPIEVKKAKEGLK